MLSVFLTFIYCTVIFFVLGVGTRRFVKAGFDTVLFSGFVVATIYAEIFSIFYKVGFIANIILIIICIGLCFLFKKEIREELKNIKLLNIAEIVILAIFWSYFASRGYMNYDSDLYHAQSIRWIEEYGVVKGLGNLHNRLAYNSALFAVSALFSMKFICGQSLHAINGFLALILSIDALKIFKSIKNKKLNISDFIRVGIIYYLILISTEVVSPASDYCLMFTAFFIILKWVELLEKGEREIAPYALLCVVAVFAISIKLSAAVLILLVVKPVVMLIKENKKKNILMYIILGFVTVLPWLIRNIIISGYLIYPFPAIDIFNVDWKIPKEDAIFDAYEIKAWGTSIAYSLIEKTYLACDFLFMLGAAILFIIKVFKKKADFDKTLLMTVVSGSFLFWYINSPLTRYGYAFILLLFFISSGYIYTKLDKVKFIRIAGFAVIALFFVWKLYNIGVNTLTYAGEGSYVMQKDYGYFSPLTYEIDGITFYYPESGDQLGYNFFPASVSERNIELRGESIKEGFKDASK